MGVIREAERVLKRIAGAGTHVVMLRGNHDAASKMPAPAGTNRRRARALDERSETFELEVDDERIAVHGRGFDSRHVTENIAATYPPRVEGACNIGMLHTSLEGGSVHAEYAPCDQADLVAHGYDYWGARSHPPARDAQEKATPGSSGRAVRRRATSARSAPTACTCST